MQRKPPVWWPGMCCLWSKALILISIVIGSIPFASRGDGTVTICTESNLNYALVGGGLVTIACDGTITFTGTKEIFGGGGDTVIDATGHNVTFSGNNNVQLFTVDSGSSLTLVNLTLANGKSANGGAVVNNGTLSMSYCTVVSN